MNHNETEKRRIKTMNNSIDELRNILSVRTLRYLICRKQASHLSQIRFLHSML